MTRTLRAVLVIAWSFLVACKSGGEGLDHDAGRDASIPDAGLPDVGRDAHADVDAAVHDAGPPDVGLDAFVAPDGGTHGDPFACAARFGDGDRQFFYAAAVDAASNVYLVGALQGTTDFGGGPLTSLGARDALLVSFDAECHHRWSRRFGDAADQMSRDVAVDPAGNVVMTGVAYGTIDLGGGVLTATGVRSVYVASFTSDGAHVWSRRVPGSSTTAQAVEGLAVGADGTIALTGWFSGTIDFAVDDLGLPGGHPISDHGREDAFVALLSSSGAYRFSIALGSTSGRQTQGSDVVFDSNGNVVTVGFAAPGVDFGAGPDARDGGFVVAYTATGALDWGRVDSNLAGFGAIAADAHGGVVVGGTYDADLDLGNGVLQHTGMHDALIALLDRDGIALWSHGFGDENIQQPAGVAVDRNGSIWFSMGAEGVVDVGTGPVTSTGSYDIMLARFMPDGTAVSLVQFGDASAQFVSPLTASPDGSLVMAGGYLGTIDLGGGPLPSAGMEDAYFVRWVY